MDIKLQSTVKMSLLVNERVYHLDIPFGAPFEEAKNVCNSFLAGIDEMEKRNKESLDKLKQEENIEPQLNPEPNISSEGE